jgi:hypothetical protein
MNLGKASVIINSNKSLLIRNSLSNLRYFTATPDSNGLEATNPKFYKFLKELSVHDPKIYQIDHLPVPQFLQSHTKTDLPNRMYNRSLKLKPSVDSLPNAYRQRVKGINEDEVQREIIKINLCDNTRDLQQLCLDIVNSTNYKPNPKTLVAIMERFDQLGQFNLSFNLIEQLRRKGPEQELNIATSNVYSTLIKLCWKNTQNPELVLRLLNRVNEYLLRIRYEVKELLIQVLEGINDDKLKKQFKEALRQVKAI